MGKLRTALLALSALLLLLELSASEAEATLSRSGRRRHEVTCSRVNPHELCDGKNKGFQVSDGCNTCTCDSQPGKLVCSIKTCPREEELTDNRLKRRVGRYCAKLLRKIQKRLRKFQRKSAAAAAAAAATSTAAEQQRWPIKCFKERKLCRDRPGVEFFDGCNRCRCSARPSVAAQCETVNACPQFVGTKHEFKLRCASLGARIEGAAAGEGGRRGGRRRQQQRRQEGEGDAAGGSLVRRWFRF